MKKTVFRPAGRYKVVGISIHLNGEVIEEGRTVDLTEEQASQFHKHLVAEAAQPGHWPTLQPDIGEIDVLKAEISVLQNTNAELNAELEKLRKQLKAQAEDKQPTEKPTEKPTETPEAPKEGKKAK
jgi:hypothetical protein